MTVLICKPLPSTLALVYQGLPGTGLYNLGVCAHTYHQYLQCINAHSLLREGSAAFDGGFCKPRYRSCVNRQTISEVSLQMQQNHLRNTVYKSHHQV